MSQPAKSMSRAPRARWRSSSGVVDGPSRRWPVRPRAQVRPNRPGSRPMPRARRSATRSAARSTRAALGLEGQDPAGLGQVEPAHLVELVVVTGEVAAGRLHQEVEDRLVDARAALDERVADRVERLDDPDLEARSPRRPRAGRSARAVSPGKGVPFGRVQVWISLAPPGDELRDAGLEPDDDAAGGGCGRLLQASHGADAALERLSRTGPLGRDQCIDNTGRIRPLCERRGRARTRTDRQLARSRSSGARSARRSTVARAGTARNVAAVRRPSRRSPGARRGAHETRRRASRVLGGDGVLHAAIVPCQGVFARAVRRRSATSGVSAPRSSARTISRSAAAR